LHNPYIFSSAEKTAVIVARYNIFANGGLRHEKENPSVPYING
jgi:hypothetical protein